jgi:hypothetical protein
MARPKKSDFYKLRWHRLGLNETRTATLLGVTVDDVKQWDNEGAPAIAERLLCLWDLKEISLDGWHGARFQRGVLVYHGKRWTPDTLQRLSDESDSLQLAQAQLATFRTWRGLITAFVDKAVNDVRRYLRRRGLSLN